MDTSYKLLIIDDDKIIHSLLTTYLFQKNYSIFSAFSCEDAEKHFQNECFDIIILDVVLPGKNGLECLKAFKKQYKNTPILMLSSQDSSNARIAGLEAGADDYLTKPFNVRELELRLNKLLRRGARKNNNKSDKHEFILDAEHNCVFKNGILIKLTSTETQLLTLFMKKPGNVFSRDDLSFALYGNEHIPLDRSLDAHINRLRKKIEDNPADPRYLKTVWGKGYRFLLSKS